MLWVCSLVCRFLFWFSFSIYKQRFFLLKTMYFFIFIKTANRRHKHAERDVITRYSVGSKALKYPAVLRLREAVGTGPEWFGRTSSKKSLFQVDFHPTCLIKAVFSCSGQISWPHKTCWCKNVDIQNNQLAFWMVPFQQIIFYTLGKWLLQISFNRQLFSVKHLFVIDFCHLLFVGQLNMKAYENCSPSFETIS